jgi:D-alanyl-D-alanine carboxypeptidase (penicillin-binding protein 5/6)
MHIMKKALLTVIAAVAVLVGLYFRPVPAATYISTLPAAPKSAAVTLPWPAAASSALGAQKYGLLAANQDSTPRPIASVAKTITALAILQKKPLATGAQGPLITLSADDAARFDYYYSLGGSVTRVQAGEQLSEYQAIEAMMLPSANNLADTMAIWAFGSIDNYTAYANKMVKSMGMTNTTVKDAGGFTDGTTGTASDLVKLGLAVIGNQALASIVSQPTASLPVAGTITNRNWLLGQDGVIGIKTGNTVAAGGCYLFAAQRQIDGQTIRLAGAILGDTDLDTAIGHADTLIKASDAGFKQLTIAHKGQAAAKYQTAWGSSSTAVASKDLTMLAWQGQPIKLSDQLHSMTAGAAAGQSVGSLQAQAGDMQTNSNLALAAPLPGPSWHWRIFHR